MNKNVKIAFNSLFYQNESNELPKRFFCSGKWSQYSENVCSSCILQVLKMYVIVVYSRSYLGKDFRREMISTN